MAEGATKSFVALRAVLALILQSMAMMRQELLSLFAIGELLDTDDDFVPNLSDNCPSSPNSSQTDAALR